VDILFRERSTAELIPIERNSGSILSEFCALQIKIDGALCGTFAAQLSVCSSSV